MNYIPMYVTVTHWLPIPTRCPKSIWPDFLYVEIDYCLLPNDDFFPEIYRIRKTIRKTIQWKKQYMEDLARLLANTKNISQNAIAIRIRLPFNRHVVEITCGNEKRKLQ